MSSPVTTMITLVGLVTNPTKVIHGVSVAQEVDRHTKHFFFSTLLHCYFIQAEPDSDM